MNDQSSVINNLSLLTGYGSPILRTAILRRANEVRVRAFELIKKMGDNGLVVPDHEPFGHFGHPLEIRRFSFLK